jgi:hypothetical protein
VEHAVSTSDLTSQLRAVLLDSRKVSEELLERANDTIEPAEAVSLLESLALIDRRRASVLEEFKAAASASRQREEERSIRQFVLSALDEIEMPQTAGFLEDYLYARELVVLKTRGMGALRRDEYRAWERLRDRPRVAYIVPCLDEQGHAVPSWMARSDWPLEGRIVVPGVEELWRLGRVRALLKAYREADNDAESLFLPAINRYAAEAFGDAAIEAAVPDKRSLQALSDRVDESIAELETKLAPARRSVTERFSHAEEQQQLWGVPAR